LLYQWQLLVQLLQTCWYFSFIIIYYETYNLLEYVWLENGYGISANYCNIYTTQAYIYEVLQDVKIVL
jgi:hypothetical protein